MFINGTVVFKHPFLSHAVRLGRGLLPYGMQMATPLGYLSATWNRAPEVWKLGRVLWEQTPDESVNPLYEGDVLDYEITTSALGGTGTLGIPF